MYPLRCAVPLDHMRSEVLFSRTYNIPNLMSYIYLITFLTPEKLIWLRVYMVAQLHTH